MNLSRHGFPGLPGAERCSIRGGWVLLAALLWALGAACTGGGDEAPAEPAGQGGPSLPVAEADWAQGKEPALVERVEYLAAQLDEYRQNLPPLEEFGYQPAWRGIWTGLVIVCGHVVPPPYQIEADLDNDLVRLNGIELTYTSGFNVSGKCRAKISAIRSARERAKNQAWKKEMDARPGVEEKCAKEKEVRVHGWKYFERRIGELGIVVDEKTGQPDNWDLVFKACRETKAELERVFGADIEEVKLPESKEGMLLFSLKNPISQSKCNSGAAVRLDHWFPARLRYRKLYHQDTKALEEERARGKRAVSSLIKSMTTMIENWLQQGQVLQFGSGETQYYAQPEEIKTINRVISMRGDPKPTFAVLLGAEINKDRTFNSEYEKEDVLILLVMAAQEHARKVR